MCVSFKIMHFLNNTFLKFYCASFQILPICRKVNMSSFHWPIICVSITRFSRLGGVFSTDKEESSSLYQVLCGNNTLVIEFPRCVCVCVFCKLMCLWKNIFHKPDNPKLIFTGLWLHFLPSVFLCKTVRYREGNWWDHPMPIFVSLRGALSKKLFSWMCSWWISITYKLNKSKFLIILDYIRVVRSPEQLLEAKSNERKELT